MENRLYRIIRLPSFRYDNDNNPNQEQQQQQQQEQQVVLYLIAAPPRPRKKRSFMTTSKPFRIQTNVSELQSNAWQAIEDAPPEKRCEYYVKYMDEQSELSEWCRSATSLGSVLTGQDDTPEQLRRSAT